MKDKGINRIIFIVLVLVAFIAVIKSFEIDYGSGRIPAGDIIQINDEWTQISPKGENAGESYIYQYVIPKFTSREMAFSMHNSWTKVQVFLDGREIYAYSDTYREQGEQRACVEIPADSLGQTLTLKFEGESGLIQRIMQKPMYLGEKNAVFMQCLMTGLYALVFSLVTCVFVVVIFICQVSLKKSISKKNFNEMTYLELFILDVGIWILTDSQVLQLFFNEAAGYFAGVIPDVSSDAGVFASVCQKDYALSMEDI